MFFVVGSPKAGCRIVEAFTEDPLARKLYGFRF
jgi:hypothetical protein